MDFKEIVYGDVNWIYVAQDWVSWGSILGLIVRSSF
jgi:hypothetical protein